MSDLVPAVAEAFEWHRALGNQVAETPLARFVMDPEHPDVWSANHVSAVRASAPGDIEQVLAELDARFGHSEWRGGGGQPRPLHPDPVRGAAAAGRLPPQRHDHPDDARR